MEISANIPGWNLHTVKCQMVHTWVSTWSAMHFCSTRAGRKESGGGGMHAPFLLTACPEVIHTCRRTNIQPQSVYILINPGMQYETTPRFRPLTSYPSRGTLTALTPDRQWTLRRADHRTLSTSDAACALSDAPRVHEALKVNSEIDPLSTATFGSTHALQEFPLTDAISDISITIRNFAIHYNL